mmetsp:Transcript_4235/g.11618  ORF Transcript_4235/g.11618 Transcript_4235/m.11618 type:complete len:96 (+) Transcript_4235:55-342(+)
MGSGFWARTNDAHVRCARRAASCAMGAAEARSECCDARTEFGVAWVITARGVARCDCGKREECVQPAQDHCGARSALAAPSVRREFGKADATSPT